MTAKHYAGSEAEGAYREWLRENPDGLVLNARRTPTAGYLKLHTVGSPCLAYPNPTKDYSKTCGSREEITAYLKRHYAISDMDIDHCPLCFRRNAFTPR